MNFTSLGKIIKGSTTIFFSLKTRMSLKQDEEKLTIPIFPKRGRVHVEEDAVEEPPPHLRRLNIPVVNLTLPIPEPQEPLIPRPYPGTGAYLVRQNAMREPW